MKKTLLFLSILFFLFFAIPRVLPAKADHFDPLPTSFAYCERTLQTFRSPILITVERADKWEASLQSYFEKHGVSYTQKLQFYTYLYLAQRDAAFLSYNVHKCFVGSLDPLTKEVIHAFFPDYNDFHNYMTDPYSEELARQVWPLYLERLEKERSSTHFFKPCDNKPIPKQIQLVAAWIPWTSPLPEVSPPEKGVQYIESQPLSEEQRDIMHKWAEKTTWFDVANDYMREKSVPLGKTLFARSLLMMGLYDATIVVLEAKYTYCVPRPIDPLIKEPITPAYPSGHAAQAGTASVILCCFFPEAEEMWKQTAKNVAQSRVWARVHTLQEIREGMYIGKQVGRSTLNAFGIRQVEQMAERRCPFSQ